MTSVGQVREAARCHPFAVDALLALVALTFALMIGQHNDAGTAGSRTVSSMALETLVFCALVARTLRPGLVLSATTFGALLVMAIDKGGSAVALAAVVSVFTVAFRTDRRTAVTAALTVGPLLVVGASWRTGHWLDPNNLSLLGWTGFAAAVGDGGRNKKAYVAAVEERARRAERTREEEASRRVIEERMRIARELHDVVAHHIAVIHVQAGVVGHLMTDQPEAAQLALGHVRHASRAVLDELGGLLDVLRQADDPVTPTDPTPSLDRLGALIDSFAASGLRVDWQFSGAARPLSAAVDLVAYRLVQEGLTNAHKHGTGSATLGVAFEGDRLAIDIVNPSAVVDCREDAESWPAPGGPGGHGLVGMRERARAVGGTLRAAGQSDGTWRVSARLPLQAAILTTPATASAATASPDTASPDTASAAGTAPASTIRATT